LVRELERNLLPDSVHHRKLNLFRKVLAQNKNSSPKIYSLHEPDVQCIAKGKEHKKYELRSTHEYKKENKYDMSNLEIKSPSP